MTSNRFTFTSHDGLELVGDVDGPSGGATVVMLHGGGQTRHSWAESMRRLAHLGYRTVSYDARGHGESEWSPVGDYAFPSLAADLNCLLKIVGRPVTIIGASMGGMTGFHAVATSDEPIIDALVMIDIALRPAAAGVEKIQTFMRGNLDGFQSLEEAAAAVAAYNPEKRSRANPKGLLKNLRLRENGRFYWHWDPRLLDASPTSEPPSVGTSLVELSHKVTVPTLLVRGDHSDVVDEESIAEMVSLIPQTEVYTVKGAGHMVVGDNNDHFISGVISFLERQPEKPIEPGTIFNS
ncbi:alpha/beta fold hydrolase [Sphingomonas bisphenolicum]